MGSVTSVEHEIDNTGLRLVIMVMMAVIVQRRASSHYLQQN